MPKPAAAYPHRVNARLDEDDFRTLKQIARSLTSDGRPDLTEAIRHLLRTWRATSEIGVTT